jgi:hypothetical protein
VAVAAKNGSKKNSNSETKNGSKKNSNSEKMKQKNKL